MTNCTKHSDVKASGLCPICLMEECSRYRRELQYRVIRSVAKSHLWVCLICQARGDAWQEIVHRPDCILGESD